MAFHNVSFTSKHYVGLSENLGENPFFQWIRTSCSSWSLLYKLVISMAIPYFQTAMCRHSHLSPASFGGCVANKLVKLGDSAVGLMGIQIHDVS